MRAEVDRLWVKYERGAVLSLEEFEALAEASFRVAVDPETPASEAFRLLYRGHRLDGANPKYAYHIGRLYLAHGQLDQAGDWLTIAAGLCPTSHRIWGHIAVLQRELDERYRANTKLDPGALRRRAEQIAAAIMQGRDDIPLGLADVTPPLSLAEREKRERANQAASGAGDAAASEDVEEDAERGPEDLPRRRREGTVPDRETPAVTRLTSPGVCRWTGIHALEIEALYRDETSSRTRDLLLPKLERASKLAGGRRGGAGAFAVLAAEWLACGYPVGSVRRVLDRIPASETVVRDLIERTCELCETDENALPAALAVAIERGEAPPMLVAMIHHRRVLWRPMVFRDLGAYQAAKAYLDDAPAAAGESDEALAENAAAHVSALTAAVAAFGGRAPVELDEPPAHVPGTDADAGDPVKALAVRANDFRARLDLVWKRLGEPAEPDAGDARAASEEASALASEVGPQVERAMKEIDRLIKEGAGNPTDLERLRGEFQVLTTWPGRLRRRAKQISRARAVTAPREAPEAADSSAPSTPAEQVAAALEAVDRAVDERFESALSTFSAYSPAARISGAIGALRSLVAGRQAETLYRMGRERAALRVWYGMLAADRLNVAVLKNIAVAHTRLDDLPQAAAAWESYLEALYFLDIVEGNARSRAEERARVHKSCGEAYGARSLLGGAPRDDEDLGDVPEFLSRTASVVALTTHRRLEALNRWLAYRSPTLVLGMSRSTDEESLERARDRQFAFVRGACGLLPDRVRAAFTDLAVARIEGAHRESLDVRRRTLKRERYYTGEERTHLEWVKQTIFFKLRIRRAIVSDDGWALSETSGDVIAGLAHIDAIPLEPEDDLVVRTAESLGISDPRRLFDEWNHLADLACNVALRRIFDEAAREDPSVAGRFRTVGESWARHPVPAEYARMLDDPQQLYGPSVAPAIEVLNNSGGRPDGSGRRVVDRAIDALQHWVERLPGATGPARVLARLLHALGRDEDAAAVLERARDEAFDPTQRVACDIQLDVDRGDGGAAVGKIRERMKETPGSEDLRLLLHSAYESWLNAGGRPAPDPKAIAADFDLWAEGVPDSEQERRAEAQESKRSLAAQAALAASRDASGTLDPERAVAALRAVRRDDPKNTWTLYFEARVLHGFVTNLNQLLSSTVGERRKQVDAKLRDAAAECAHAAQEFLAESPTGERRAEVERILGEIQSAAR